MYRPELDRRLAERKQREEQERKDHMARFEKDLLAGKLSRPQPRGRPEEEFESPYHGEDDDADYEGGDEEREEQDEEEDVGETDSYAFLRAMQQQKQYSQQK